MTDEAKKKLVAAIRREEREFWATVFQMAARGHIGETANVLWAAGRLMEESKR